MAQQIEKQLKLHVAIRHIVYAHLHAYACPIGGTAAHTFQEIARKSQLKSPQNRQ